MTKDTTLNVLIKKRISRYLTVIATVAFMAGCTTTTTAPEDIPPALFSELEANSDFYMTKDEQLGSDDNLACQFLAIQALIKEKQRFEQGAQSARRVALRK